MKRRDFVTRVGAAAAATLAGCAPADTDADRSAANVSDNAADAPSVAPERTVTWRLASSFPRALDTLYGAAEWLADEVSALSGGTFRIVPYPGGEIVPGLQVMDAAQQGTVEIAQTAAYYFTGKHPALMFDTSVPFGLNARQQTAWLTEGGGLEALRAVYADFGLINFTAGSTGMQMGGWFRREVGGLSELRGLKIRIPGLGGEVMQRLGATVQVIPGGEVYTSLERGAIDAAEWIGPYDDERLGFHRIAPIYMYPGWWEPGPTLTFMVNRAKWDRLSSTHQRIFEAACRSVAVRMQAQYDQRNPPALTRIVESGTTLAPFPNEIMSAAEAHTRDLLEERAASTPAFKTVYDSWRASREEQNAWWRTGEFSFAQHVLGR